MIRIVVKIYNTAVDEESYETVDIESPELEGILAEKPFLVSGVVGGHVVKEPTR